MLLSLFLYLISVAHQGKCVQLALIELNPDSNSFKKFDEYLLLDSMSKDADAVVAPTRPATGNVSEHTSSDSDGAATKFNEQTNYVPRRTIITV